MILCKFQDLTLPKPFWLKLKSMNWATNLNDFTEEEMNRIIQHYGEPKYLSFTAEFIDHECELVRRSAAKGRNHDITCFIPRDGGYACIQKHDYADTGIFRAPSGGAFSGESIEDAAFREMYEETGLEIKLKRFVLDLSLDVRCKGESIPWRSLVFLAEAIGGEMKEVDTYEIYAVRVVNKDDLLGVVNQLMEASGWGGFKYRAFLTRSFFDELDNLQIQ